MAKHVAFETESIDRMYLNVYQPSLQIEPGAAMFFRGHRGEAFATALVMARMTRAFLHKIEQFAEHNQIPIIPFEKGVRKESFKDTWRTLMGKRELSSSVRPRKGHASFEL